MQLNPKFSYLIASLLVMTMGCGQEFSGPSPRLEGELGSDTPEDALAWPGFTCAEQTESWIELRGDQFSPLVIDALVAPAVKYPTVILERVATVEGDADPGPEGDAENLIYLEATDEEDSRIQWIDQNLIRVRISEDLELAPGVYDVKLLNPNGESFLAEGAFGVLHRPVVMAVEPEMLCLDQEERAVVVHGDHFLVRDDDLPTLLFDGVDYAAEEGANCRSLAPPFGQYRLCRELTGSLPAGSHEVGRVSVAVQNGGPQSATCQSLTDHDQVELVVVPAPVLELAEPDPICGEQLDYESFRLTGEHFIQVSTDGQELLPTVTIGDVQFTAHTLEDCASVEGVVRSQVESCRTLLVEIPADSLAHLVAQLPDRDTIETADQLVTLLGITVENPAPAGCVSTQDVELRVVPAPRVDFLDSNPICVAQQARELTIMGAGFLVLEEILPSIHVGERAYQADGVEGCLDIGDDGAQSCLSITFTIDEGDITESGNYEVRVTNPQQAHCTSQQLLQVTVVPPPQVDRVEPQPACIEGGESLITVFGSDFLSLAGQLPTIELGSQSYLASAVEACVPLTMDETGMEAQQCSQLTFVVHHGDLPAGLHSIRVTNPEPAGCTGEGADPVLVVGSPNIITTEPVAICSGELEGGRLALIGTDFLRIDEAIPEVTVNGISAQDVILSSEQCEPISGSDLDLSSCTLLEFIVPEELRSGDLEISVTNPAPADCDAAQHRLVMGETPQIDDVQPQKVCSLGGDLQLMGEHFEDGMAVDLDGEPALSVTVSEGGTQAVASFGELPAGLHTLTATNPSGCAQAFEANIRVTDGPVPFFVDPAVAYNELTLRISIYLGNLYGGSVEEVYITDSQGVPTPLSGIEFNPERPTVVQAVLPAGLTADTYSVTLVDEVNCPGTGEGLLVITDQADVVVSAVHPPFGWTQSNTGVSISSDPEVDEARQFAATPRVYINPSDAQADAMARELRATLFLSPVELSGVVAAGLNPGLYDIIVLNPDGGVGVLEEGFRVTEEPPPLVNSVSPGSWDNQTNANLTIGGEHFRDGLSVVVECRDSAPPAVTITEVTPETILATVNSGGLAHLDVCAIRIINDDTSYDEFSPITVTNPASNFIEFMAGTPMDLARRKPVVSSGVPTRGQRFIYVIGGDDGTPSGAYADGVFCATDRFGTPQTWRPLPYDLPSGVALSKAFRLGDFVYLAGGYGVSAEEAVEGASAQVLRANVLDPLHVVEIDDVDLQIEEGVGGLEPGVYYYRVAVVLDETDPANPLGETLASDPQPIRIPDIDEGVHVSIGWNEFSNAQGYRVYRSAAPDLPYGSEVLIAEVAQTDFTDDGSLQLDASVMPLRLGSLGNWHEVAQLSEARFNHGLAVAPDPVTANRHVVYAVGGENDVAAMASIELLTIDVVGPRLQVVAAQGLLGDVSLTQPTTQLEAVVANRTNASRFPDGRHYLIAYGGMAGGGVTGTALATEIHEAGELDPFTPLSTMSQTHAGFVGLVANNLLIAAYGSNGQPNNGTHRAELCGSACAFAPTVQAGSGNWRSMGDVAGLSRYLPGHTVFRGFLYVAGGLTTGDVPTATLDYSPVGTP